MEVSLHLISLVVLFGVATGLTLSLLLWVVYLGNRSANRCLSLLLATYSLLAVVFVLQSEGLVTVLQPYTLFSLQMIPGPLLYFYTRILTSADFRWQTRHLSHLLPALCLALLWQLQLQLQQLPSPLLKFPCPDLESCNLFYNSRFVHRVAAWISIICYSMIALGLLKPHLRRIKENYSAIEEVNLYWLKTVIYSFLLLILLIIVVDGLHNVSDEPEVIGGLLQAFAPLFLSLLMGWFGIQQRNIYDTSESRSDSPAEPQPGATLQPPFIEHPKATTQRPGAANEFSGATNKKYQTSSLKTEDAEAIWHKLQQVMANDAPHLEHGLKIFDLAQKMGVSVNHLSETINGYANQSFYDFMNKQRVEEAKRLMSDQTLQHLSVTDIGFQSGFNSNSTFFTHFKKHLKQTPRQYRKQLSNKS